MLTGNRMCKTEHVRMKSKAADRVAGRPVLMVTDNRVTHIGHMHANLILSACFELTFHQRIAIRRIKQLDLNVL